MDKIDLITQALNSAAAATGQTISLKTVIISPSDPEKGELTDFVAGLEVIYAPTAARITLGRCSWTFARAFEVALHKGYGGIELEEAIQREREEAADDQI
jgi:hypothetical protein